MGTDGAVFKNSTTIPVHDRLRGYMGDYFDIKPLTVHPLWAPLYWWMALTDYGLGLRLLFGGIGGCWVTWRLRNQAIYARCRTHGR